MYGDFSRLTFNRASNYTSVWSQQGRVQLDCDFNEQTSILLDWMRTLAIDFIGPYGGHIERAGFGVSLDKSGDLILTPGHYYVGGIRCEVPACDSAGRPITYRPNVTPGQDPITKQGPYLVYLTVWEGTVNQLIDTNLVEPALGPCSPDTTLRTKVRWVLRFIKAPDVQPDTLDGAVAEIFAERNRPIQPRLAACVTRKNNASDPDEAATMSGYSGLENQLYRVEVHRDSREEGGPTFKWSRDNGSIEFGIDSYDVTKENEKTVVTLTERTLPGRPQLLLEDCVEVIDQSWQPIGAAGRLYTVIDVGRPDPIVTLDGPVYASINESQPGMLRRWDSVPVDGDGTYVERDQWVELENGIQIKFCGPPDAVYRRGDYWLIPARAATGQIYGPTTHKDGATPYGPKRRYAPLAYVDRTDVTDLRSLFTHLAWPSLPEVSK